MSLVYVYKIDFAIIDVAVRLATSSWGIAVCHSPRSWSILPQTPVCLQYAQNEADRLVLEHVCHVMCELKNNTRHAIAIT